MQIILNFLSTRLGAILTPVVAAGVASLVAWIGTHVPWLKPLLTDQNIAVLIGGAIAVIMALVNYLTTARGFKYGKEVQQALNVIGKHYDLTTLPDGVVAGHTALVAETLAGCVDSEIKAGSIKHESPAAAIVSNPNGKG